MDCTTLLLPSPNWTWSLLCSRWNSERDRGRRAVGSLSWCFGLRHRRRLEDCIGHCSSTGFPVTSFSPRQPAFVGSLWNNAQRPVACHAAVDSSCDGDARNDGGNPFIAEIKDDEMSELQSRADVSGVVCPMDWQSVRSFESVGREATNADDADIREKTRILEETLERLRSAANTGISRGERISIGDNDAPCFNHSERWRFLTQLPHRLIRDIGFVLASPSIILDSDELPTVSAEMTGESSSSWQKASDWLKKLPVEQVIEWFETHRYSTRLGDHFAVCVEYVIRFAPLLRVERLLISQQVSELMSPHSPSMTLLERVNRALVICDKASSNEVSQVGFPEKNWVECFDLSASSEVVSEKMVGAARNSSMVNANLFSPELEGPSISSHNIEPLHCEPDALHNTGNISGIEADRPNETLFKDSSCRKTENPQQQQQRWQIETFVQDHGPLTRDLSLELEVLDGHQGMALSSNIGLLTSSQKQRRRKKKAKVVRPYLEENFTRFDMYYASPCVESSSLKAYKKRGFWRKPAQKLQQIASTKPTLVTVGEFDFLFQCQTVKKREGGLEDDSMMFCSLDKDRCLGDGFSSSPTNQTCQKSMLNTGKTEVHHWEASLQFLLYAGPWEAFGLVTPSYAAWRSTESGSHVDTEVAQPGSLSSDMDAYMTSSKQDLRMVANRIVNIDRLYISPDAGANLNYRKLRMRSQLALCRHVNASPIFHKLLTCTLPDNLDENEIFFGRSGSTESKGVNSCKAEESVPSNGFEVSSCSQDHLNESYFKQDRMHEKEIVRVFPRALVQGYLFYEYELWHLFSLQRSIKENRSFASGLEDVKIHNECHGFVSSEYGSDRAVEHFQADGYSTTYDQSMIQKFGLDLFLEFGLNPEHWMGWWCRIKDFRRFACSPYHKNHMWYIVPKCEWLSPVVIDQTDAVRCTRIFNVDEFLLIAAKVDQEATELEIPRKRRFMLAEVFQDMNFGTFVNHGKIDQRSFQNAVEETTNRKGPWVEVSRGFVMEDTWPESKLDKPHGFSLSWSHSLLGLTPNSLL